MISFLLEEGVLTVGTMSGLFTAAMLNSFRINILEPIIENIAPSYKLDKNQPSPGDNIMQQTVNLSREDREKLGIKQENFAETPPPKKIVRWQTFLRDFITWIFVMMILYLFWKYVLKKFKKN
jgi:large-conductance mechanosensitive channel